MSSSRIRAIFAAAQERWGVPAQIDITIEEMAELIQALVKHRRNAIGCFSLENSAHVVEEIADVLVMVSQLRFIFGSDLVDAVVQQKIERLADRLAEPVRCASVCPACHSEAFVLLTVQRVNDDNVEIWRCTQCQHVERR